MAFLSFQTPFCRAVPIRSWSLGQHSRPAPTDLISVKLRDGVAQYEFHGHAGTRLSTVLETLGFHYKPGIEFCNLFRSFRWGDTLWPNQGEVRGLGLDSPSATGVHHFDVYEELHQVLQLYHCYGSSSVGSYASLGLGSGRSESSHQMVSHANAVELLATVQDGTFFTSQAKAHLDGEHSGLCHTCHVPDTVTHRALHCPDYQEGIQLRFVFGRRDLSPSLMDYIRRTPTSGHTGTLC